MSGINLSLPVDIPWRQLATSYDMIDTTFGSGGFPPKWRSSLAIFWYEPPELPEDLQDRRVTYFKVVCSITGYQTDTIDDKHIDFGKLTEEERGTLAEHLNKYYACYGALLQVNVVPALEADRQNRSKYPFIVDFEPKRRDLYEIATDTGEVLSASSNRSAVSKGFTSTFSSESTSSLSATGGYGGKADGGAGSVTGSISDKTGFGTQDTNLTQIDYAREKRESQSHVTSLTQMYNLLQGYHVGTNRAVFLVLPRPHVLEEVEKRSFINGPREIEGVQEFFLVVSRPAEVQHVCIEAYLETGHLDLAPGEATAQARDEKVFTFDFPAPRSIQHGSSAGDDSTSKAVSVSKPFTPPQGWEVDLDQGEGGYLVTYTEGDAAYRVTATPNGVVVTATVVTVFHDVTWPSDNYYTYQDVSGEVRVFLKKKKDAAAEDIRNTFFVTARRVAGCTDGPMVVKPPRFPRDWLVFEDALEIPPALFSHSMPSAGRMRLADTMRQRVGRLLLESLHAKARYRPGAVSFEQSQFVLDRFARVLRRRHKDSGLGKPIGKAGTIPKVLREHLAHAAGADTPVEKLFALPVNRLKSVGNFDTIEEALAARWSMLGIGPRKLPA